MSNGPSGAEALFAAALAIVNAAEQAAFLDQACAGDAALRAEVESLLAAHAPAEGFRRSEAVRETAPMPPSEKPGERIGRDNLLEIIGEGGFGVVWIAEQEEPVRRKVALRIIKLGMDTREVVARFEAERQALALMDHPNIPKVLDAGSNEPSKSEIRNQKSDIPSGRPYFVLELVRGTPITEYCEEHKLTIRERLELFMQVCEAVQHAHQKGIIHRELKPSNIPMAGIHPLRRPTRNAPSSGQGDPDVAIVRAWGASHFNLTWGEALWPFVRARPHAAGTSLP
jgi:non-specific serine/threonine protein kinase/serine/threonine-protein kinase